MDARKLRTMAERMFLECVTKKRWKEKRGGSLFHPFVLSALLFKVNNIFFERGKKKNEIRNSIDCLFFAKSSETIEWPISSPSVV